MHPGRDGVDVARVEVVKVQLPDGSVIDAEVSVPDSVVDVGVSALLQLGQAKDTIESFVSWAVDGLSFAAPDGDTSPEPSMAPAGMHLGRMGLEFGLKLTVRSGSLTSVIAAAGGEASAVVRLEWERSAARG
jgi:NTP-dependent ternary system trypsin peptidase co-occuring protein